MVLALKRRGENVPRSTKQGFGGKHKPSEGSRCWQEAKEVTDDSSVPVLCASCPAVSDPTVTPSTRNAQGKELWAVCPCRSEQREESAVKQQGAFLLAAMRHLGDLSQQGTALL